MVDLERGNDQTAPVAHAHQSHRVRGHDVHLARNAHQARSAGRELE